MAFCVSAGNAVTSLGRAERSPWQPQRIGAPSVPNSRSIRWRCQRRLRVTSALRAVQVEEELSPSSEKRTTEAHGGVDGAEPTTATAPRFNVRLAKPEELYAVSDVRASSFYEFPLDGYFYPVRRREIYQLLKQRIGTPGSFSFVVTDREPPDQRRRFTVPPESGELVVGSADASLYDTAGTRTAPPSICNSDRLYISSMAVRQEFRGMGLGRLLLEGILDRAPGLGLRDVFLHVDPQNAPAVALYSAVGFETAEGHGAEVAPRWLRQLAQPENVLLHKRLERADRVELL